MSDLGPKTLGEAMEHLSYPSPPCACRGGPDCCVLNAGRANNLKRGAHILARQLSDLVEKRAEEECGPGGHCGCFESHGCCYCAWDPP